VSAPGVQLVLLRCPGCGSALDGGSDGLFLYCRACGRGYELSADEALEPVPVAFAIYTPGSREFHPFWVFDASLRLGAREAQRSLRQRLTRPGGLMRLFEERGSLTFYCAGSPSDLDAERSWSLHLTREQPQLAPAERQPQVGGLALSQGDARVVAEHLFLVSEIEQADVVRDLEYTLELTNPRVLVVGL
jgi:hypothetical protein